MKYLYFFILFILPINAFASEDSTKIVSIYVNNIQVSPSNMDQFTMKEKGTVDFSIGTVTNSITQKIYYKVFLNGIILNAEQQAENDVHLTDLSKGNYILKAVAYLKDGEEFEPALIKFTVEENRVQEPQPVISSFSINEHIYCIFIGSGLIIFTLAIGFVVSRKRKTPVIQQVRQDREQPKEQPKEVSRNKELQENIDSLVAANTRLTAINKSLKSKINTLETHTAVLEESNKELIEQKDKLLTSKTKLENLQKKKEQLFAIAVHDLKNPAGAIKGYVELLQSYDLNAMEQQEIMEFLSTTSVRIIELAQQLSTVIAETDDSTITEMKPASIKKLIDKVCRSNENYAKSKGAMIINTTSPDLPELVIDAFKIEEVLENLVNNAIKFANKDVAIHLKSYVNVKAVTIEISDNGVGMSESDLLKVFTKGAKLSAKPTAGEKSSGLGLWIVKNVIEEHGGRIWVESTLGKGAKFTFELPIK